MKQPVQMQIENPSTRHDAAQGEGGAAQGEAQTRAGVGADARPQGEGGATQGEAQARRRTRRRRGLEREPARVAQGEVQAWAGAGADARGTGAVWSGSRCTRRRARRVGSTLCERIGTGAQARARHYAEARARVRRGEARAVLSKATRYVSFPSFEHM
jgi:hypothetical protein